MKLFYQLKLDAILLPTIALLICLGGWAMIAGHGKTTVSVDDWGDTVTKTERFGLSKNLPSPTETWVASKPYVVEPFGMLDALTKMELQEVLLELWRRNKLTTLMVTHDVDEAIFLSDRVVMMTDGPEVEVGDILTIPFARPRIRAGVLGNPRYMEIRNHLLTFLNDRSHIRPSKIQTAKNVARETVRDFDSSSVASARSP